MKIKKNLILSLLIFILQSTILQKFRVNGIIPNLNLIIIVILVIYYDLKTIIIYSIAAGLLQDIYLSQHIGINIFIYLIIGLTIINFESFFNKVNLISPVFLITMATWIYNTIFYAYLKIMNFNFNIYRLIDISVVENILNIICIVVIFNFTKNRLVER